MHGSPSARSGTLAAVALAVCLLLAALAGGAFVGVAAGADEHDGTDPTDPDDAFDDGDVGPITECFAGEGYPLSVGDPPATIDGVVHLSVLTDPANGGEVGVELAGTLNDDPIVTLAAGARLSRAGLLATGVNPFAAFDLLYTYELRLPMFQGHLDQSTYEADTPPVGSAAGVVPC